MPSVVGLLEQRELAAPRQWRREVRSLRQSARIAGPLLCGSRHPLPVEEEWTTLTDCWVMSPHTRVMVVMPVSI
jgi:hypothetical protein